MVEPRDEVVNVPGRLLPSERAPQLAPACPHPHRAADREQRPIRKEEQPHAAHRDSRDGRPQGVVDDRPQQERDDKGDARPEIRRVPLSLGLHLYRSNVLQGEERGGLLLGAAPDVDEAATGEGKGLGPKLWHFAQPLLQVQGRAQLFSGQKLQAGGVAGER
ncbi:MAG: hypothetical protein FJ312_05600 [SAR202 cluster bacterium]|nr:hypothetical protein [SAR202 cluster bacterium]